MNIHYNCTIGSFFYHPHPPSFYEKIFILSCLSRGANLERQGAKGTSLKCVESIYVRTTETTCLGEELCLCKGEEEGEDRQIVSLGDLDMLNTLTVRVVVLEYSL